MKISLLGWTSVGLRCPDVEIDLSNGTGAHQVSLIQMPNGTGKTTTLELLRAGLSGYAKDWKREDILKFKSTDYESESGIFTVKLSVDSKVITFEMRFIFSDFKEKVYYRTTHGSGIQDGWHPPLSVRKFLDSNFIKLFIFDGELATSLLDSTKTRAKDSIEALFQLSLLSNIKIKFAEFWGAYATQVNATEESGLTRRRNRVNDLSGKLKSLKLEQVSLRKEKKQKENDLKAATSRYELELQHNEKDKGEHEKLKNSIAELDARITNYISSLLSLTKDPFKIQVVFYNDLVDLKKNLDKLKLPKSTSREFFIELANDLNQECICGTLLDDVKRKKIIEKSEEYLAEDASGILNSIKSDIGTMSSLNFNYYNADTVRLLDDLGFAVRDRRRLLDEKIIIEESTAKDGSEELTKSKTELDKIQNDLLTINDRLKELERSSISSVDDCSSDCIKAIEKCLEEAENNLAEITHTLDTKRKCQTIEAIINKAFETATKSIKNLLIEETNTNLKKLLPLEPISLANIDNSLKLTDREGSSVGQSLALAYGFLSTLFHRGNHELPFIVDSPAGPLDRTVRGRVAQLVPKLCNQFVAFIISSERDKFVPQLELEATDIQYLTLFRKNAHTEHLFVKLPKSGVQEAKNSVLVNDKIFFNNFDLEEEGK